MENIRSYIKTWEYDFQRAHGRLPSKQDIKKDPIIRLKYKQYSYYKQGQPEKAQEIKIPQLQPETPNSQRVFDATNLIRGDDSPTDEVTELGPTPQLNGRVLSIFDILRSPQKSPLKQITTTSCGNGTVEDKMNNASPFNTPIRKKLNMNILDNPIPKLGEFRTPVKPITKPLIEETPAYFNDETPNPIRRLDTMTLHLEEKESNQTGALISLASESPTLKRNKPIKRLIGELHDIKDDLRYGDYDLDELIPKSELLNTLAEEEVTDRDSENLDSDGIRYDQNGTPMPMRRFERKVKRQTRRVKMKARPLEETDKFEEEKEDNSTVETDGTPKTSPNIINFRLRQVSREILPKALQTSNLLDTQNQNQEKQEELVDENSHWSDSDDIPYVKNTVKYDGKKRNSYNNFKSIRINKPKRGGRFGRR